jgi:hypothetical protein
VVVVEAAVVIKAPTVTRPAVRVISSAPAAGSRVTVVGCMRAEVAPEPTVKLPLTVTAEPKVLVGSTLNALVLATDTVVELKVMRAPPSVTSPI